MNKLWSLFSLIVLIAVFTVGVKSTGKIIPPPPWGDPPCKIADFNPFSLPRPLGGGWELHLLA